jgi:hypothetical protein
LRSWRALTDIKDTRLVAFQKNYTFCTEVNIPSWRKLMAKPALFLPKGWVCGITILFEFRHLLQKAYKQSYLSKAIKFVGQNKCK